MRIAMMTNNYKPFVGGVPVSIERLSRELRLLGHEVFIFAPSYGDAAEEDPFVIRYRSYKKRLKGGLVVPDVMDSHIDAAFAALDFDIIHVHQPMLIGYIAHRLGRKHRLPVVFTYHTRYEHYLHYIGFYERLQRNVSGSNGRWGPAVSRKLLAASAEVVAMHNRVFTNRCDLVIAPTPGMKRYL